MVGLSLLFLLAFVTTSSCCSGGEEFVQCNQILEGSCLCFLRSDDISFRACPEEPSTLDYSNFGVSVIQPGSFRYMTNVESLNLSSNPGLSINWQSFVGLTNLTVLDLGGNALTSLPDCLFTPLILLETLYLHSNNLTELNSNAFKNLTSLKQLYVDDNILTELSPDLLNNLSSLENISLSSNRWNCSSIYVATLVDLVKSGRVINGNQLMCSNSTLVIDLGRTLPPSSVVVTPSSVVVTPSSVVVTPSTVVVTLTSSSVTPTLLQPTPTATVVPKTCHRLDNSPSLYGFLDWPQTSIDQSVSLECPNGPDGGVASRECGERGEWETIDGTECTAASETTQMLIMIVEIEITASNIENVSASLSSALSTTSNDEPLSLNEIEIVLDIIEELITFNGTTISVLHNSLQAVDYLLSYSGESLIEGGSDITDRLRMLIDTALLSSLSDNNTNLVFVFSHLALGGVYISGTNHTHIIAVITMGDEGGELVIGGEGEGGGDVEVIIDGDIEGPVQVTVYNDSGLFNTSNCGMNDGIEGENDIAPVISVFDETTDGGSETITITYHTMSDETGDVLCVRWNNSLNCGLGGWQTDGCKLLDQTGSDITCECMNEGTFGIIDAPSVHTGSSDSTPDVVEYIFYGCCIISCCSGGEEFVQCNQILEGSCLCFQRSDDISFRACPEEPSTLDYSNFGVSVIHPGSFRYMTNVESLNLSSNPGLSINWQSFVGLTNLTVLDLGGNELTSLPDCLFTPLISLETLYLHSNNLTELNSNAFKNLTSLKQLYVDDNILSELSPDLLNNLPSLENISLSSNKWNCSSIYVATLVDLVKSGRVINGNQLMCSNSTLVIDLGRTLPPSSVVVTPSSVVVTPSSVVVTPSTVVVTLTSSSVTPTLLQPTPTATVVPKTCRRLDNSPSLYGFLDWPQTSIDQSVSLECPNGPDGGVASRECGERGEWETIDGTECTAASETTQMLIMIVEIEITASNIENVSASLSSALSTTSNDEPLSLNEIEIVLDVIEELITFNGTTISVLHNSLQAVDYLLSYSGESLIEGGSDITDRLRMLIDTALLSSLSDNNTNLVFVFSHLALGGVYISGTNHTHIIAVITMGDELVIGGECEGGGDVEVIIDGDIEGPVQVTVYNDSGLFNTSNCGMNDCIEGENDIAPVISVFDETTDGGSETITITYHTMSDETGDVLCVRWNNSLNCGLGGWQTDGCKLLDQTGSDITCECMNEGTFGIIDAPSVHTGSSDSTPDVVEYIFYGCCIISIILYLPVIIVILWNRSLRVLPLKQCVANIAASQALSLLTIAASYHPHQPHQLCYTLGVLQHYMVLVALAWLAVYPVMTALKVFRRTWFEHYWLLLPVIGLCWILPAMVVGGIDGSRYESFTDSPDLCWLEADVFPSYFIFISGLMAIITLLLTTSSIIFLCCSDYDLELPTHLRIASSQLNSILYSITIIILYLTADSKSHSHKYALETDYLLVLVGILAVLMASHFLLANGWANSHIRSTLLCHEDPVLKRKVAHYNQQQKKTNSQTSSRTSEHRNLRRNGTRLTDEMNLNYVNSYLGYDDVATSHVPLDMFVQLDGGRGQGGGRVKDRRSTELPMGGPTGFRNVGFKVPHATSMV